VCLEKVKLEKCGELTRGAGNGGRQTANVDHMARPGIAVSESCGCSCKELTTGSTREKKKHL
jgi:hypothetical protein